MLAWDSIEYEHCSCGNVPAVELDDDLAGAVVIDLLELANVTWKKKE